MNSSDWIGWLSSLILLLTIGYQIYKQWSEETSRGVSAWLYIGQFSAQIGFIYYSLLVKNWVFTFTNSALLVENFLGLLITLRHKRRGRRKGPTLA